MTEAPDNLTWELLGAYELSGSYEEWCELIGLVPRTDTADRSYLLVHTAYVDLWTAMGADLFFTRLAVFAEQWRAGGSGRVGKRSLVARIAARITQEVTHGHG